LKINHLLGGFELELFIINIILSGIEKRNHAPNAIPNNDMRKAKRQQIAICDKFLWNGKFKSDRDVNQYFKIMDSIYFFNKKKRKKPSTRNLKSGQLKSFLSYEVLNAGFSDFLHHFNFISNLKKITCPTLILSGNNDWVCSPSQSKIISRHVPNSKLRIFQNCGHAITSDANDKYIVEVKKFLRIRNA